MTMYAVNVCLLVSFVCLFFLLFSYQAEQQQVYGTIINTYNVSVSDIADVNGTDANATAAVPETVFTMITEEGDTRIGEKIQNFTHYWLKQ